MTLLILSKVLTDCDNELVIFHEKGFVLFNGSLEDLRSIYRINDFCKSKILGICVSDDRLLVTLKSSE